MCVVCICVFCHVLVCVICVCAFCYLCVFVCVCHLMAHIVAAQLKATTLMTSRARSEYAQSAYKEFRFQRV